ncbi:hypothetical protein DERF_001035 [Dermatophagoides farinae]|uniref:Uncharacterized protein n=1 Tax=Dermatophagoides farinae TaxID=6954 RepID=A0A922IE64_DERFA|nr:hypothetical protein DERF_001035 [Dermatophagoides farinae]
MTMTKSKNRSEVDVVHIRRQSLHHYTRGPLNFRRRRRRRRSLFAVVIVVKVSNIERSPDDDDTRCMYICKGCISIDINDDDYKMMLTLTLGDDNLFFLFSMWKS